MIHDPFTKEPPEGLTVDELIVRFTARKMRGLRAFATAKKLFDLGVLTGEEYEIEKKRSRNVPKA